MATVSVEGASLVVRLRTLEKIGAVHGDLRVPLASVRAARAVDNPFAELRGLRAPGAGLPGVVALGTWRRRGGAKDFVAVYRGNRGAVIELRGAEFERLILSADDPDTIAAELTAAAR